jgi:hypothetical protein
MDYADYVRGISFRFYRPQANPARFHRLARRRPRWGRALEVLNTRLPAGGRQMRRRLGELCAIPRMSTFAIGALINEGVRQMAEGHCFVNVGVWYGFTYLAGLAGNPGKRGVGVDNFSEFGSPREQFYQNFEKYRSPNHQFHDMDCADYFAGVHEGPIGFYIYDGSHDYESQLEGLRAAEPFFGRDCVVMVDDTNWPAPRQATLDFIASSSFAYRVLIDAGTYANLHPTLWNGLIVFRRVG